jgi:hypothetical protein
MGDQRGIGLVRLRPRQPTLGIGRDARWIDDADDVSGLREAERQRRPLLASRFQAGMRLLHSLLSAPAMQGVEPLGRHGEAPLEQAPVKEQRRIERHFGHSDAQAGWIC